MNRASIEARQATVPSKPPLPKSLSTIQGYGLAVLSVSLALGGALLLGRFTFRDVEVPLFLFALAVAAWYGGTGGALLALLLSFLIFYYFFLDPLPTLYIFCFYLPYFIFFPFFSFLAPRSPPLRPPLDAHLCH